MASSFDGTRSSRINALVLDHLQRRHSGEQALDAVLISEHPELMPELAERLVELAKLSPQDAPADRANGDGLSSNPCSLQIRCPHCGHRIEVLTDSDFGAITCSSCGSQFSLAGEPTHTREAPTCKQIAHFELVERLGLGSFGTVWKARDTELDRTVAVKIPRRGRLDPSHIEKFLREARAAAQLNHKNIVRVYEVGRDGDAVYIVSELIRGVSMADWLTCRRPTCREAAELCAKLADALHHAHESGVIHRDLKPQNIMLDGEDEPHIMDFGLAKREVGEVTMTLDGQLLGTPAYMSPEQARGEAHEARRQSDVYSLGVILFELLTGELPFRGNARMLIHQVLHDEPPSPRRLNGNVPKDLETICLRCLEKDWAKRYPNAATLSDELLRTVRGEPIQARPVSQVVRGWRWCLRNRMVSASAVVVVVALTVGTLIASWQAIAADRQRQVAERNHYHSLMNLIRLDWEQTDIGRVRASLQEAASYDDRGYEYFFWQHRLHRSRMTFHGHLDRVAAVATSGDGRLLATASNDGTVKIWNIKSGRAIATLRGHTAWVRSVAFLPDGNGVVSSSDDLTTRIWDINTKRERLIIQGHTGCRIFSALSSDGQQIATASYDGHVRIWDSRTGDNLRSLDVGFPIWSVTLSPDGGQVVIGKESHEENHGEAQVWDLEQKTCCFHLKHNRKLWASAYSPNGKWIITASMGTAAVWDARTGDRIETFTGQKGKVVSVQFSPGSDKIATGHRDGMVKVWRWDGHQAIEQNQLTGHEYFVWATAFLNDNQTLATGSSDGTVKLWDITKPEPQVLRHPTGVAVNSVAFVGRKARVLASGCDDGVVRLWNAKSGKLEREFSAHDTQAITSLSIAPNGNWIVAGHDGGSATTWDLSTGKPRLRNPLVHNASVNAVSVSPNGLSIATGSDDQTVKIWNSQNGRLVRSLTGAAAGIKSVVFSPDSRQIVATGRAATVWDLATGRVAHQLDWRGNYYAEECLAISKKLLLVGGRDEWQRPKADVWERTSGQHKFTLRGHEASFRSGCFSPDGHRIVTSSSDGTTKVWDATTGQELLTLKGHTDAVASVAISADGLSIATASLDGTVRVWNAASTVKSDEWERQDAAAARYVDELKRNQLDADRMRDRLLRTDPGAVRQWLVLGPIPLTASQAETALQHQLINESQIVPRRDESTTVFDQTMHWQAKQFEDHRVDFRDVFGPGIGRALAYAVCFVHSDAAQEGVRIEVGHRGRGCIYLNGRNVYKRTVGAVRYPGSRDTVPNLTLKAGSNTLVCKYVHVDGTWSGALWFSDAHGNSLPGIRVSLQPVASDARLHTTASKIQTRTES